VIRRLLILRGRFLDAGDMEMRSKVCLIPRNSRTGFLDKRIRSGDRFTWGS